MAEHLVNGANWVDTADVSVPLDEEEFEELLFTSRGFVRLHANTKFGRESHVRTITDEVIEIGERGVGEYPLVLAHPYRVWIDLNKVLKRGLEGSGTADDEHRKLRIRIAKKVDFLATQVGLRVTLREKESNRERSAERLRRLDSRELYNYGTLLALAEEQSAALRQFNTGSLDWWEKTRINSRSDAIQRQLIALGRLKARQGLGRSAVEAVRSDLDSIAEVGLVGRRFSEGAFGVLAASLEALESEFPWASATPDAPRAR